METTNGTIIFSDELYQLNIKENNFNKEDEQVGPSPDDIDELKKGGLM